MNNLYLKNKLYVKKLEKAIKDNKEINLNNETDNQIKDFLLSFSKLFSMYKSDSYLSSCMISHTHSISYLLFLLEAFIASFSLHENNNKVSINIVSNVKKDIDIKFDEIPLIKALYEITLNAIEANSKDINISIYDNNYTYIQIQSNTTIKERDFIFDKFVSYSSGYGLGLYIAKEMIKHFATIELVDTNNATFLIKLEN